jgi:sRNA-binding carbon storage regulator CsrA
MLCLIRTHDQAVVFLRAGAVLGMVRVLELRPRYGDCRLAFFLPGDASLHVPGAPPVLGVVGAANYRETRRYMYRGDTAEIGVGGLTITLQPVSFDGGSGGVEKVKLGLNAPQSVTMMRDELIPAEVYAVAVKQAATKATKPTPARARRVHAC